MKTFEEYVIGNARVNTFPHVLYDHVKANPKAATVTEWIMAMEPGGRSPLVNELATALKYYVVDVLNPPLAKVDPYETTRYEPMPVVAIRPGFATTYSMTRREAEKFETAAGQ